MGAPPRLNLDDHQGIEQAFHEAANMRAAEIEAWLATEESRAVGWTHEGEAESVGHESGRLILAIKRKRKADRTETDYAHMRKVVGYVHRHLAQRPDGDVSQTRWRCSS